MSACDRKPDINGHLAATRGAKKHHLCFRRHCINDAGFDEFDFAFTKDRQIYFFNSRCGFVVHLFERPAISRSTHYRPPVLRRLKGLLTVLCDDVSIFYLSPLSEAGERPAV